jgi:hypothetical protein
MEPRDVLGHKTVHPQTPYKAGVWERKLQCESTHESMSRCDFIK